MPSTVSSWKDSQVNNNQLLIIFLFLFLLFLFPTGLSNTSISFSVQCCVSCNFFGSLLIFLLFLLLTLNFNHASIHGSICSDISIVFLCLVFLFLLFLLPSFLRIFNFNFLGSRFLLLITIINAPLLRYGYIGSCLVLENLTLVIILVELGSLLCSSRNFGHRATF